MLVDISLSPYGIIVDENDDIYIVSDQKNNRIIQFNEFGTTLFNIWKLWKQCRPISISPKDVAIDSSGFLYVTNDTLSNKIQKFVTPIVSEKLIRRR